MRCRAWAAMAAAVAMTLLLGGCGLNAVSSPSESLTIYAARPKNINQGVIEDFERAHPEYAGKVRVLNIGSQEVLERIRAESRSPQADIWWGGTSQQFEQAVDANLLTKAPGDVAKRVPEKYRGSGERWLGEVRMAQVIAYNSDMMSAKDAPKDWDDLISPKNKGKILIRDVAPSGTMRSVYSAMIGRWYDKGQGTGPGYRWLRNLDANTKEYTASPTDLYLRIQRQEAPVTIWNLQDVLVQRGKGVPFTPVVPASGAPMLVDGVGKVKGGPNSKAANTFMRFLFQEKTQQRLANEQFQLPTIPLSNEPKWLTELDLKEMKVDWPQVARHENEWITHWSEQIKGRG